MSHISVVHSRSLQRTQTVSVGRFSHLFVSLWLLLQVCFLQPLSFALYFSFYYSVYKFGYVFYIRMARVKRTSTTRFEYQYSKEAQRKKKDNQILLQAPQLFIQVSLIQVKYSEAFLCSPLFTKPWHFSGEEYLHLSLQTTAFTFN